MTTKKEERRAKAEAAAGHVMNIGAQLHNKLLKLYQQLPATPELRKKHGKAVEAVKHARSKLRELWVAVDTHDNKFLELLASGDIMGKVDTPVKASDILGDGLPKDEHDLRRLGHELGNAMEQVNFKLAKIKEKVELEKHGDDLQKMSKEVNDIIDKEELRASHKIKWTEDNPEPVSVKGEDSKNLVEVKKERNGYYYARLFAKSKDGVPSDTPSQTNTYTTLWEARSAAEEMLCRAYGCYDD